MILAGIDYSMTSPGLCIDGKRLFGFTTQKKWLNCYELPELTIQLYPKYEHHHFLDRADYMSEWILNHFKFYNVTHYIIEGYAFGGNHGNDNGEHTGILKYKLWKELGLLPVEKPSPNAIKKHFCNNGKAEKKDMVEQFEKITQIKLSTVFEKDIYKTKTIPAPFSDLVDAYALYHYGKSRL